MSLIVHRSSEVSHRYVFELRYDFGHYYWDRAGRIARELASCEGWLFESMDGNACRVVQPELNIAFSFGHLKLDLAQTQSREVERLLSIDQFAKFAAEFSEVVIRVLELDAFSRIGFRAIYLYPTSSKQEASDLLATTRMLHSQSECRDSLGRMTDLSHAVVVERQSHIARCQVGVFEQKVDIPISVLKAAKARARGMSRGQRVAMQEKYRAVKAIASYPQLGINVDLDAFIEDLSAVDSLTIANFVHDAEQDFSKIKEILLTRYST